MAGSDFREHFDNIVRPSNPIVASSGVLGPARDIETRH